MPLGLTPDGYAVYTTPSETPGAIPAVVYMNGGLLFFKAYNDAKVAAEAFIQSIRDAGTDLPAYVWIGPTYKTWYQGNPV